MKKLELSKEEILQFQYLLPVQGDLKTLELVEGIINKVKIENEDAKVVDFENSELLLMYNFIMFLDSQKTLSFQSLKLIRKILNTCKEIQL